MEKKIEVKGNNGAVFSGTLKLIENTGKTKLNIEGKEKIVDLHKIVAIVDGVEVFSSNEVTKSRLPEEAKLLTKTLTNYLDNKANGKGSYGYSGRNINDELKNMGFE